MAALLGGLVIELLILGVTSIFVGPGGAYGAPIPVGDATGLSPAVQMQGGARPVTFSPALFAINVLLIAGPLAVAGFLGRGTLAVAVVGCLIGLVGSIGAYMRLPFAPAPFPVAHFRGDWMDLVALWLNVLAIGTLFAMVWILVNGRRAHVQLDKAAGGDELTS